MTVFTPPIGAPPEGTAARAPPLRLQLEVDEPLLRLIRFMRSVSVAAEAGGDPRAEKEDQPSAPAKKGRRKLRRVALGSLQLGPRKITRTDEVDVAAKFQYNVPRKIVCQMRRGDKHVKIDILWSKIQAMSACFDDEKFDTLTIEAKSSSEQYRAGRPPVPRMHLQWRRCADITTRTFCLECDKGTLEIAYGKMLYTDPSLMLLTLRPPPPPPPPGGVEEDQESQASADTPKASPDTQQSGTNC